VHIVWMGLATKILMSIISLLFVAGVSFVLAWWLWHKLLVKRDREHLIHLHHRANFRAFYYLAIESADPSLRFQFLAGKKPLAVVSPPDNMPAVETKTKAPVTKAQASTIASRSVGKPLVPEKALKVGKQAAGKVGVFAGLLGALAGILPGSMGRKLKEQQEAARKVQMDSTKALQAPRDVQLKLDAVQKASQKLGVKVPAAQQPASSSVSVTGADSIPTSNSASSGSPVIPIGGAPHSFNGLYCAQTVDVEPGQTLPVTLRIGTRMRRYPIGSFGYTIRLQVVPAEPLQEKLHISSQRGTVNFAPVAVWRYWLPGFSSLLVALLGLLSLLNLALIIWK